MSAQSKPKILNDQLEAVQRGTGGAWSATHLAGLGHVLALQCQWQTWAQWEVQRGCDPICMTIKALFNLALRQAMGMAQSLIKLAGLDWEVSDFSTGSRR